MRTVVGVLRGGPSSEYDISLLSGAAVLQELPKDKYDARDLFVDRSGVWHSRGVAVSPERALAGVDAVFNVIHGEYGEDGNLHRILDPLGVPYTGPESFASVRAFNKKHTYDAVRAHGIKVPHGMVIEPRGEYEAAAHDIFRTMPMPMMVKPVVGGSSVGMSVARTFHDLEGALERAAAVSPRILVDEYIQGREATVGVIDNFRNHTAYALMPVEIIPPEGRFFDYEVKYNGASQEIVPSSFSDSIKKELERIATVAHTALGMRHYSRSDLIVSRRGIYLLEVNSAPAVGLTKESLLPKALHAVGSSLSEFLDHVVGLVTKRA